MKANAGSHTYPDNETIADQVNRGQVAFGLINQYYWYRLNAEIGASHDHSRSPIFAPHDPGYVLDVSGAAVLASSQHQAAAQQFVAYLTSRPARTSSRTATSFEYPLGSGVTTAQPETPFNQLQPNSDRPGQLGDGRPRSPCSSTQLL